jgi:hypothetical protein
VLEIELPLTGESATKKISVKRRASKTSRLSIFFGRGLPSLASTRDARGTGLTRWRFFCIVRPESA